jgi:hypothetical protein
MNKHKHRGMSSTVVWPLPHHDVTVHLGAVSSRISHYRDIPDEDIAPKLLNSENKRGQCIGKKQVHKGTGENRGGAMQGKTLRRGKEDCGRGWGAKMLYRVFEMDDGAGGIRACK